MQNTTTPERHKESYTVTSVRGHMMAWSLGHCDGGTSRPGVQLRSAPCSTPRYACPCRGGLERCRSGFQATRIGILRLRVTCVSARDVAADFELRRRLLRRGATAPLGVSEAVVSPVVQDDNKPKRINRSVDLSESATCSLEERRWCFRAPDVLPAATSVHGDRTQVSTHRVVCIAG